MKRREGYLKGLQSEAGNKRDLPEAARSVREGVPKGWLTTREAAERLGVNRARVRDMRLMGRLRGERIWRGSKPLKFWYYPDYEVDRALSLREETKRLAGLPLQPVPTAASEPPAPSPAPAREEGKKETPFVPSPSPFRLDADGPEPKWACDDVDLTLFFTCKASRSIETGRLPGVLYQI